MSDQDFFFDEDEEPKQAAPKSSGAKKGASSAPAAGGSAVAVQANSMTVMALVAVVALLLGMIVGLLIGRAMASPTAVPVPTATVPSGGEQPAPQLTPEQMEGGQLPEGHPSIDGAGGSQEATQQ